MATKSVKTALLFSALTLAAIAQEPTQVGVGVGLSNESATLRLPINLDQTLRVEPELGLTYRNGDKNDQTGLIAGAGLYFMQQPSNSVNLYYGGKLLLDYASYDYGNGNDDSSTRLILGGVLGFEYMLERHVGVGGEAGAYLGVGDETTLQTQGLALLRYYF